MNRVLVVGGGGAGVAAAWAAQRSGAEVLLVSSGVGASGQSSGAMDGGAPECGSVEAGEAVRSDLTEFLEELFVSGYGVTGAPRWAPGQPVLLATCSGVLRRAATRDPYLLDLATLPPGSRVVVVDVGRADFPAPLLVRSYQETVGDRLVFCSRQLDGTLVPKDLPLAAVPGQLAGAGTEQLLRELGRLAAAERAAAILIGPWLPPGALVQTRLEGGALLGETTSPPDGPAGARLLDAFRRLLAARRIECQSLFVDRLLCEPGGVLVPPFGERFSAAIVATGGLVGGGVKLSSTAGGGWEVPLMPWAASGGGSLGGLDLTRDRGRFVLSGFAPGVEVSEPDRRLFAAGDVRSGSPLRLLAAVHSGLRAGRAAHAASSRPAL